MAELKRTSERGFEFACRLIDEYRRRRPADDAERRIWWQLLKAGPSVGANASESDGTQSPRDFIAKFHVALKEGRESLFWLRLLKYSSPDRTIPINALSKQCDELVAILVASLRTAKRNEERRTKNEEQRTKNEERRTKNKNQERRTAERTTKNTERAMKNAERTIENDIARPFREKTGS